MAMFDMAEYDSGKARFCPCGASENDSECVEAHPWQKLAENEAGNGYMVEAQGEDLELRCNKCGSIYWVPGRIQ